MEGARCLVLEFRVENRTIVIVQGPKTDFSLTNVSICPLPLSVFHVVYPSLSYLLIIKDHAADQFCFPILKLLDSLTWAIHDHSLAIATCMWLKN